MASGCALHVGALWRLNDGDAGTLSGSRRGIDRNGVSARQRSLVPDSVATAFGRGRPIAGSSRSIATVLTGWVTFRPIANALADLYDRHLFHGLTLQGLPDDEAGEGPRFVFNATSMQTGVLFRFSRDHAGDYLVGRIDRPDLPLSHAVAASSAFPPMLSPIVLHVPPGTFVAGSGKELQIQPYTSRVVLTDGGVYDNLGLEAVWRRFRRILVSDASAVLRPIPVPSRLAETV